MGNKVAEKWRLEAVGNIYGGREVTQTQDYLSQRTKAMNMHAMHLEA